MTEWLDICPAGTLGPGEARAFEVAGLVIALFNVEGEFLALENLCTHDGSPLLLDGLDPADQLHGARVSCPHHGAVFCLRTGVPLTPPASEPAATFKTRVESGTVQLCLPALP